MLEAKFSEDPYRYNDKNMGRFVNLFTILSSVVKTLLVSSIVTFNISLPRVIL